MCEGDLIINYVSRYSYNYIANCLKQSVSTSSWSPYFAFSGGGRTVRRCNICIWRTPDPVLHYLQRHKVKFSPGASKGEWVTDWLNSFCWLTLSASCSQKRAPFTSEYRSPGLSLIPHLEHVKHLTWYTKGGLEPTGGTAALITNSDAGIPWPQPWQAPPPPKILK